MHDKPGEQCMINYVIMHCSPGLSCIDHVTDHVLIMFGVTQNAIMELGAGLSIFTDVISFKHQKKKKRKKERKKEIL